MANVASSCIQAWNQQLGPTRTVGLIAVAFDQRNHGSREVNALANKSWKGGNETHAQDMFRFAIMNSPFIHMSSHDVVYLMELQSTQVF